MILVLVPLAGVVLGIGLYLALRAAGVLNVLGGDVGPRESRSLRTTWGERAASRHDNGPLSVRERAQDIPSGCLLAIIIATAVWIIGWLIVLIFGLSLLS